MRIMLDVEDLTVNDDWIEGVLIARNIPIIDDLREAFRTRRNADCDIQLPFGPKLTVKATLTSSNEVCVSARIVSLNLGERCVAI